MIIPDHFYFPEVGLGSHPRRAALDLARCSFEGLDARYAGTRSTDDQHLFALVDEGGRLAKRSVRSNRHVAAVKRAGFFTLGGELGDLLDRLLPTEQERVERSVERMIDDLGGPTT